VSFKSLWILYLLSCQSHPPLDSSFQDLSSAPCFEEKGVQGVFEGDGKSGYFEIIFRPKMTIRLTTFAGVPLKQFSLSELGEKQGLFFWGDELFCVHLPKKNQRLKGWSRHIQSHPKGDLWIIKKSWFRFFSKSVFRVQRKFLKKDQRLIVSEVHLKSWGWHLYVQKYFS
jgi:hypothetical protein